MYFLWKYSQKAGGKIKAERKEFLKSNVRKKKPPVFSDTLCVYDFLSTIALKLRCYTRLYKNEAFLKDQK